MLTNLVVYSSETGNTKKLAEEIYNSISPKYGEKKLVNIRSWNGTLDAENYYIGFWVNRGSCSLEIIDLISSLHNKNVAFFGTCGFANNDDYCRSLEQNALVWLDRDNYFLGSYFCRGKMNPCIRDNYEACREKYGDHKVDLLLRVYEESLSHPNRDDLLKAHLFAEKIQKSIPSKDMSYV